MLSLPAFTQIALTPCLPLLADECRLSLSQISQAIPNIQKVVTYQILAYIQAQGTAKFETQILQHSDILAVTFGNNTLKSNFKLDFASLTELRQQITPLRQTLFASDSPTSPDTFAMLIGLLADRTRLPLAPLIQLFDWVTLLTLKVLTNIQCLITGSKDTISLKQSHYWQWLSMQEMLMANASDTPILAIVGYRTGKSMGQLIHEQQAFSATNPTALTTWQSELHALLHQYLNSRPLSIVPLSFSRITQKQLPATTAHLNNKPLPVKNTAVATIFTPIAKPTWKQKLQQHWMVTAVGLTGLVFGGLALVLPLNKTPTPTEAVALQAKLQQDKQKAEQAPHDVAIVKVTPQSTPTALHAKSATNHSDSNHATSIKTAKTSDTHTAKKVSPDKANIKKSAHVAKKVADVHSTHKKSTNSDDAVKTKHPKKADTPNTHATKVSKDLKTAHKKSDNPD